jgi:hypothetical protein
MPPGRGNGKLYRSIARAEHSPRQSTGGNAMVGIAAVMFVGLFGWGAQYFGWSDPDGKVQLALFTSFVLGAVCGYKSKG